MDSNDVNREPHNVDKRQPDVGIHRKNSKWWLIPLVILLILLGLLGAWALNDEMDEDGAYPADNTEAVE